MYTLHCVICDMIIFVWAEYVFDFVGKVGRVSSVCVYTCICACMGVDIYTCVHTQLK